MTVMLARQHPLARIRVTLWDGDARYYRYQVDVATDAAGPWTQAVDRTAGEHRGRCEDTLTPVDARYVRLTGTHGSPNAGFHVVELPAYASRPPTYAWTPAALEGGDLQILVAPDRGLAPLEIEALALAAGPGVICHWHFGDGATATGELVTHTYWSPGTYIVLLKAAGRWRQATVVVRD